MYRVPTADQCSNVVGDESVTGCTVYKKDERYIAVAEGSSKWR